MVSRWVLLFLSSTFFSGFLPGKCIGKQGLAGGTMGALVALIVQFLLRDASLFTIVTITVTSFLVGWTVIGPAEQFMLDRWGTRRRHTGAVVAYDFNETNIDEFHGQFVAALPIWVFGLQGNIQLLALVISFVLFRLCDTKKPWPVNAVERAFPKSAFGIMIDDTVAGLIPAIALTIFLLIFPQS